MTEKSLADAPTPDPDDKDAEEVGLTDDDDIEDATEAPDEDDYDFLAFVQGVRPTRRAVVLYQRNDIRGQIDLLEEKIKVAKMAGEDTSEDEELLAEAAAEVLESGRRVVVEAKSSDWVKQFRKTMKARGVDPWREKISDEGKAVMMTKYINTYIAEHIVYPKTGISPEAVAALAEGNEQEAEKLHQAVRSADGERGVSADFLRARSAVNRSGSR